MKRAILLGVLVLLTVAVVYGYTETRRERMFREFVDQGETALAGENPSGAVEAFSVAIALRPETMLGYLKRGEAYQRQGDLDAALKDLLHAARLDPASPRALELLGDVNAEKRRYDRASEHYRAYIALDDRSPRVLYKLALAEHSASQPLAAIDVLNRALALSARFAEAHYLLALCYRDLNRPQEARRSLERAIEIAPTLLHAREELAEQHRRAGRHSQRIDQLDALLALDPTPPRFAALAVALAASGRTERAIATLGAAAERFPDYGYTFVVLGRIWLEAAGEGPPGIELSKALEALEKAAAVHDSSEALTLLGRALLMASEQKLAEQLLQRATEKLPADPLAFFYLAEAAERNGRADRARRALLDYRALRGEEPDPRQDLRICQRIADLSMTVADAPTAVAWYRRAVSAADPGVPLLLRLAEAQVMAGTLAEANDTLTQVLQREPGNRAARLLRARIR